MEFSIRRAGHVVLNVTDVERTKRFLEDVLGFQVSGAIGAFYFLTADAISNHHMIAIRAQPNAPTLPKPDPARQLGMVSVTYEVVGPGALEQLRARAGSHVVDARRRGERDTIVCSDPDGNWLEFWCVDTAAVAAPSSSGIRSTSHLTLRVKDLERSLAFYEGFLAMHTIATDEHGRRYLAGSPSASRPQLALEASADPSAPLPTPRAMVGMDHFALELGSFEELQTAYRHFIDTATPIHHVVDHGVTLSLYFNDPDGNLMEVYHDVPRAEYLDPAVPFSGVAPLEERLVRFSGTASQ